MKKRPYEEGTWFVVPLQQGGYATGCVSRVSPKGGGTLLGYFFGPIRNAAPKLSEVGNLEPTSAVWVSMFGHLGLLGGIWPIVGKSPQWQRENWPIPAFYRVDPIYGKMKFKVIYDDNDPGKIIQEIRLPETAETGLPDGLAGAGFVEEKLSRLLADTPPPTITSKAK